MQAVKQFVLSQLNTHVEPFVENFNTQDLNVSVFTGAPTFLPVSTRCSLQELPELTPQGSCSCTTFGSKSLS